MRKYKDSAGELHFLLPDLACRVWLYICPIKAVAFEDYAFYGGMPLILSRPDEEAKMEYLRSLFTEVYLRDIVERKKVAKEDVLEGILDLLCSSVGSLTNPTNVANAINSAQKRGKGEQVSRNTVSTYMGYLEDALWKISSIGAFI